MLSVSASILLLVAAAAGASVAPARYVFTFGDSYTTTGFQISGTKPAIGNQFGNPAYPGQTTDGAGNPNWVDWMVRQLSPSSTLSYNFAVYAATVNNSIATYGSGIKDFTEQVGEFEKNLSPAPSYAPWTATNSIAMSYFGTNDVNLKWNSMPSDPSILDQIMDTYFTQLSILYESGVRRFVVFILDPLMRTPIWSSAPYLALSGTGHQDVVAWNNAIGQRVSSFKSSHPNAAITTVDSQNVFNTILNNPKAYGSPDQFCQNKDGTSCLWYDTLHPGLAIQKALGQAAHDAANRLGFYA